MFLQVIEATSKIVDLLGNTSKISEKKKHQKLGKRLVDLHQHLSRLADQALEIENFLGLAISDKGEYLNYHAILGSLNELLEKQALELGYIQNLLRDETTREIINIYDEGLSMFDDKENYDRQSLWLAIRNLAGLKKSLIDLICVLIENKDSKKYILPKTFNLEEVPAIQEEEFEDEVDYNSVCLTKVMEETLLYFPTQFEVGDYELNDRLQKEQMPFIKAQFSSLLEQVIRFKTSQRLLEIKNKLAHIIRSNFTLDELF